MENHGLEKRSRNKRSMTYLIQGGDERNDVFSLGFPRCIPEVPVPVELGVLQEVVEILAEYEACVEAPPGHVVEEESPDEAGEVVLVLSAPVQDQLHDLGLVRLQEVGQLQAEPEFRMQNLENNDSKREKKIKYLSYIY